MRISAVIITKNEARNIGRCLQSLEGIADEIIVVDTFSEDGTQEICRQFGATVVEKEWLGYAATKNYSNEIAQGKYILSLDADEALTEELRAAIIQQKKNLSGAYQFNRLAFYCGKPIKHGGWYPDRKIRLFPKGEAKWEGAYVHEELVPNPDLKITWLSGDLLHYTYYTLEEHLERAKKYAQLASEKLQSRSKSNLLLKAIFSPTWRFLQMYIFKLGFLDGYSGYKIASITAQEVAWKYRGALRKNQK